MTHRYAWRKWRPDLYGRSCRLIRCGALHTALVEFEDGTRHVVSRRAIRRLAK